MEGKTQTFDWDVVIIGAGPVGGHTANLLAQRGQRVLLIEEHNEIGRPFQCAGLVTPNAMKQADKGIAGLLAPFKHLRPLNKA